jgi:hypothetical protein
MTQEAFRREFALGMARQMATLTRTMVFAMIGVLIGRQLPGSWTPVLCAVAMAGIGDLVLLRWWRQLRGRQPGRR